MILIIFIICICIFLYFRYKEPNDYDKILFINKIDKERYIILTNYIKEFKIRKDMRIRENRISRDMKKSFVPIKPTIIFAGVSVINQWIDAIKTFTSLTYFAVFDVRHLQQLINKMDDKSINSYDIIITRRVTIITHHR